MDLRVGGASLIWILRSSRNLGCLLSSEWPLDLSPAQPETSNLSMLPQMVILEEFLVVALTEMGTCARQKTRLFGLLAYCSVVICVTTKLPTLL